MHYLGSQSPQVPMHHFGVTEPPHPAKSLLLLCLWSSQSPQVPVHHSGSQSPHVPVHYLGSLSPQVPVHHVGSQRPQVPVHPLVVTEPPPSCPAPAPGCLPTLGVALEGITLDVAGAPQPLLPPTLSGTGLGQDPPVPVTALARVPGCGGTTQRGAGGAGLPLTPSCRLLTGARVPWAGISEDSRVEAPAFTDAIRMYRQSREQYGTWDMLCGNETQVSAAPPPREGRAAGGWAGSPKTSCLRRS